MFKKMFILIVVMLFVGCATLTNYYANDWGVSNVKDIERVLMKLDVKGKAQYKNSTTSVDAFAGGICWPIGEGYIIALTHATKIKPVKLVRTPFGMLSITRKVIEEKFYIEKKEIKLIGRVDDISIFYHKDYQKAIPAKWGDSNTVSLGDKILIVGSSYHIEYNVKDGVISLLEVNYPRLMAAKNSFMFSAPGNPGDSGSPIFAKKGNNLEIIGIVSSGINEARGIGFALKSNYIKDCVKKIIGIDILTPKENFNLDRR